MGASGNEFVWQVAGSVEVNQLNKARIIDVKAGDATVVINQAVGLIGSSQNMQVQFEESAEKNRKKTAMRDNTNPVICTSMAVLQEFDDSESPFHAGRIIFLSTRPPTLLGNGRDNLQMGIILGKPGTAFTVPDLNNLAVIDVSLEVNATTLMHIHIRDQR